MIFPRMRGTYLTQCKVAQFFTNIALFNSQRLHQLQKIFGFEPQQLGCGGAVSVSSGKRLQD